MIMKIVAKAGESVVHFRKRGGGIVDDDLHPEGGRQDTENLGRG